MFNKTASVSDYIQHKENKEPLNYKSLEDKEFEKDQQKMQRKVNRMLEQKMMEFSFEVAEEKKHFKELDDIQEMINKAEESYKLFKKTGRINEAK
jgi:hypothetical protein